MQHILTLAEVSLLAEAAASRMYPGAKVYAVPRGGIPAALAIGQHIKIELVSSPKDADFIVDDLIDSGATEARVLAEAREVPGGRKFFVGGPTFVALIDKRDPAWKGRWIVFPWEETAEKGVEDHFVRILQFMGEDSNRGGLIETPARAAKAWQFWTRGYAEDPAEILKTFEDGAEGCNEMVVVRDIPLYSHCEHHLAAIFGTATVAYIPNGRIVGLSKINRVVDCFARRLQVQERLTAQVADALMDNLQPKGVGVVVKARHMCMESRGVCQQGHSTITSALRGVFADGTVRQEFLALTR